MDNFEKHEIIFKELIKRFESKNEGSLDPHFYLLLKYLMFSLLSKSSQIIELTDIATNVSLCEEFFTYTKDDMIEFVTSITLKIDSALVETLVIEA